MMTAASVHQRAISDFAVQLNLPPQEAPPDLETMLNPERAASRISFLPQDTRAGELYIDPKDLMNHLSKP